MYINALNVQAIGIGFAAFLSTLITIFIFLSARKERLGRAMMFLVGTAVIWSWFGFLYETIPNQDIARNMRVISVIGIVWMSMAGVYFARTYLEERVRIIRISKNALLLLISVGVPLTLILLGDLFGGRLVVGRLDFPAGEVLAPNAGPMMSLVIAYYALCILVTGILIAHRARAGIDAEDRRQANLIFMSLTVGMVCGGTRFTPWYGFDFQPLVGAFAAPLFTFAAFYSMKRYKLLNVRVAMAQILVFLLWTFTFFRALLGPSLKEALPDIGLFVAVLILGIFLLRSITTEIRTEKELNELTLEHVKTEFVVLAAHQLQTPLRDVQHALSLLAERSRAESPSGEQDRLIQEGHAAANKMLYVVNDLVNVARISSGVMELIIEPGDVRQAIQFSSILFLESAQNKNISFKFDMPNEALRANFDRGQLATAIENLIDNSIKYTQFGGSVSVSAAHDKDKIVIKINDTGIGISKSDQKRLFEKFFRGEEAVKMSPNDSGLGLFVAKNIVEEHGGTLTIESMPGKGTTATITVPAVY
jgi:signal transduction histidine kinase